MDLYRCNICSRYFKSSENLSAHDLNMHDENDEYTCEECNEIIFSKFLFKRHKRNHRQCVKVKCSVCGILVPRSSLKQHTLLAHKLVLRTCLSCYETFLTKAEFDTHLLTHQPTPPPQTTFAAETSRLVEEMAEQRQQLTQGLRDHPMTATECPHCERVFMDPMQLDNHRYISHRALYNEQNPFCHP